MKTSIGSICQVKGSPIDERYRLLLLNRYLKNIKEVPVARGDSKWVFCCPFCSTLGRTEAKRDEPEKFFEFHRKSPAVVCENLEVFYVSLKLVVKMSCLCSKDSSY